VTNAPYHSVSATSADNPEPVTIAAPKPPTSPPPPDMNEPQRTACHPPKPHFTSMDPFDIPIEPIRPPHIEVDPSLRTITRGVDRRAAIDAPVPEARATTPEHLNNFERNAVTHVVIQQVISPGPRRDKPL
jgi:hypothetical protein